MKKLSCLVVLTCFVLIWTAAWGSVQSHLKPGDLLPEFVFQAPYTEEEREYLGLVEKDFFTLKELEAEFFLIEVVGTYCPICHIQSDVINALFNKISDDELLKDKMLMFSVSSGSTEMEVNYLKNTWQAPYPMVSDLEYDFFNLIQAPGVPFTLMVSRDGLVLYSNQGRMPELSSFMAMIKDIVIR